MEHNKLVYIASPYSGDVERNVAIWQRQPVVMP